MVRGPVLEVVVHVYLMLLLCYDVIGCLGLTRATTDADVNVILSRVGDVALNCAAPLVWRYSPQRAILQG